MRLRKFSLYSKLHQKLKHNAQREYKFQCSLDLNEVPSILAKWCVDEKFYRGVNEDIFNSYCSFKHQGNQGQLEKPFVCYKAEKNFKNFAR